MDRITMKYFKNTNGDIFGFESDGSQDFLIKNEMTPLTDVELDKLFNPEKYMSKKELLEKRILFLRPLTKAEFKKLLFRLGKMKEFEKMISEIEDENLCFETTIEYEDGSSFPYYHNLVKNFLLKLIDSEFVVDKWESLTQQ